MLVSDCLNRAKDLLYGAAPDSTNLVYQGFTTSDNVITVRLPVGSLEQGMLISHGLEIMFVVSVGDQQPNGNTAINVVRGFHGSPLTSAADNDVIEIAPHFTLWDLYNTFIEEIRSWGPDIYQVKTLTLYADGRSRQYQFAPPTEYYDVLRVNVHAISGDVSGTDYNTRFAINRNTNDGNGNVIDALVIPQLFQAGQEITVSYSAPFDLTMANGLSTDLATIGINPTEWDVPPYGIAWRKAASQEMRRLLIDIASVSSDPQENPFQAGIVVANDFKKTRDGRLNDARRRLARIIPLTRNI
jgi:hypothetical protein